MQERENIDRVKEVTNLCLVILTYNQEEFFHMKFHLKMGYFSTMKIRPSQTEIFTMRKCFEVFKGVNLKKWKYKLEG